MPLLGGASRTGRNIESTLPWGTKYDLLCQKRRAVLVVFKIDQSLIGTQGNCKKMQRQSVSKHVYFKTVWGMCGWVKTIGKRYVDGNQICRGKKIRFQKKRKTSVRRTGFKSWAPLCDIPTSHLVFVTNSFLKVLDIYSIHSLSVVTFMNYPELVGRFRNSLFACLRHTSKFHHQASF